jgi:hypothetical protein
MESFAQVPRMSVAQGRERRNADNIYSIGFNLIQSLAEQCSGALGGCGKAFGAEKLGKHGSRDLIGFGPGRHA